MFEATEAGTAALPSGRITPGDVHALTLPDGRVARAAVPPHKNPGDAIAVRVLRRGV